jgi:DNA-binding protein H-NS
MVKLVENHLVESSILQYKREERSQVAKRMITSQRRFKLLIKSMKKDNISTQENVTQLKTELVNFTNDRDFKKAKTMGHILETALAFVKRNYLEYD